MIAFHRSYNFRFDWIWSCLLEIYDFNSILKPIFRHFHFSLKIDRSSRRRPINRKMERKTKQNIELLFYLAIPKTRFLLWEAKRSRVSFADRLEIPMVENKYFHFPITTSNLRQHFNIHLYSKIFHTFSFPSGLVPTSGQAYLCEIFQPMRLPPYPSQQNIPKFLIHTLPERRVSNAWTIPYELVTVGDEVSKSLKAAWRRSTMCSTMILILIFQCLWDLGGIFCDSTDFVEEILRH